MPILINFTASGVEKFRFVVSAEEIDALTPAITQAESYENVRISWKKEGSRPMQSQDFHQMKIFF